MQSTRTFLINTTGTFRQTIKCLSNGAVSPVLTNRNPRNLERIRIAYKPDGYHIETQGRRFWHKLQLTSSGKYVTAMLTHYTNPAEPILRASTKEWSLKRQLYRYKDSSAYINLGRVFAQRCLQSGLTEMYSDVKDEAQSKERLFLESLLEAGISLSEPSQYKTVKPWDQDRPEKPWEDNS